MQDYVANRRVRLVPHSRMIGGGHLFVFQDRGGTTQIGAGGELAARGSSRAESVCSRGPPGICSTVTAVASRPLASGSGRSEERPAMVGASDVHAAVSSAMPATSARRRVMAWEPAGTGAPSALRRESPIGGPAAYSEGPGLARPRGGGGAET